MLQVTAGVLVLSCKGSRRHCSRGFLISLLLWSLFLARTILSAPHRGCPAGLSRALLTHLTILP